MGQRNFVAVCVYLIRFNVELDEVSSTETRRDSNIGCVPARSHQNSTEARVIVPCIKVDPPAVKKNLIPGAEISRTAKRLADIPDMAGDIACWNIHAASKCDGEVLEIAADANPLDEDIRRGLGRCWRGRAIGYNPSETEAYRCPWWLLSCPHLVVAAI
jgi:hypothetical protein